MTVIGLGTPAPASFRMIALGLAPQVDGLTDHPYGGRLPELVPYAATPDMIQRDGIATADAKGTLASQVSMFRAQARKWGATEKLWHTEWGYATVPAKPESQACPRKLRRFIFSGGSWRARLSALSIPLFTILRMTEKTLDWLRTTVHRSSLISLSKGLPAF